MLPFCQIESLLDTQWHIQCILYDHFTGPTTSPHCALLTRALPNPVQSSITLGSAVRLFKAPAAGSIRYGSEGAKSWLRTGCQCGPSWPVSLGPFIWPLSRQSSGALSIIFPISLRLGGPRGDVCNVRSEQYRSGRVREGRGTAVGEKSLAFVASGCQRILRQVLPWNFLHSGR